MSSKHSFVLLTTAYFGLIPIYILFNRPSIAQKYLQIFGTPEIYICVFISLILSLTTIASVLYHWKTTTTIHADNMCYFNISIACCVLSRLYAVLAHVGILPAVYESEWLIIIVVQAYNQCLIAQTIYILDYRHAIFSFNSFSAFLMSSCVSFGSFLLSVHTSHYFWLSLSFMFLLYTRVLRWLWYCIQSSIQPSSQQYTGSEAYILSVMCAVMVVPNMCQ